jgi:hypothetical protein
MSAVLEKGAVHPAECANCGTSLNGKFCHACGQRAHVHRSLLHLGEELLHGVLHFDAKGVRTLPMLTLHPGQLTRQYIDGHRTRYVSPLALFLFMVVAMFFIASLTSGRAPGALGPKEAMEAEIAANKVELAKAYSALEEAKKTGRNLEGAQQQVETALEVKASLEENLGELVKVKTTGKSAGNTLSSNVRWKPVNDAIKHANDNPELALYKLKSAGPKYSFLLVPITLPFLWLLFCLRRGVTMYDHAVFSLYSLSFMALLASFLFIINFIGLSATAGVLLVCIPPLHMFSQLRGTYGLSKKSALWRTVALLLIAGVVIMAYLLIILILSQR